MTMNGFQTLFLTTLRAPRQAARQLLGLDLPLSTGLLWALGVASLSTLISWLAAQLFTLPEGAPLSALVAQPLWLAALQFGGVLLMAAMMVGAGRLFQGRGRFAAALVLAAWIETIMLVLQAAQLVLTVLFPIVAALSTLVIFGLLMYLAVQFTKALHDLDSTPKVVFGLLANLLVFAMGLAFLAGFLGLVPEVPA